jgi:hypothetical protein
MLFWKTSVVRDDDNYAPLRIRLPGEPVNETAVISNIDFEYTERVYNIHFYTFSDMLAQIGGLRSSLGPILGLVVPFFTMSFLHTLAGLIQKKVA